MKKNFLLAFALLSSLSAGAQVISQFASGFFSPVGINRDTIGNLWVAEQGTGINDGRVFKIDTNTNIWLAIDNLPSYLDTITHEIAGPWHAVPIGGNKIIVVIGGGGTNVNAGTLLTFDMSGFDNGEPPLSVGNAISSIHVQSFMSGQGYPDSNPYNFTMRDSDLYIVDAGADAIVKFTDSSQALSIYKTFDSIPIEVSGFPPSVDYVPTDIISRDSASFYVCNLTGAPFIPGLSSIAVIDSSDSVSTYKSGLSLLVDMEMDTSGNLFALQFGAFDSTGIPIPNSAKIFQITDSSVVEVASNFGPAAGMALDGQGGFYVTELIAGDILHITSFETGVAQIHSVNANLFAAPNPFHDATTIQFSLNETATTDVSIFSLLGQEVFHLPAGNLSEGLHQFNWNGKDLSGNAVQSGIYFVRIKQGTEQQTIRLVKE